MSQLPREAAMARALVVLNECRASVVAPLSAIFCHPETIGPEADVPPERFTCLECGINAECEFAFDPYNLDGDCLEMK